MKHDGLLPLCLVVASAAALPAVAAADPQYAVDVTAGAYHSCMVTSCGDVLCWGRNDDGQADDQLKSRGLFLSWYYQPPFVAVTAGDHHTCALDVDGEILCWGRNTYGQASPPSGPFLEVDAGANHTCALRSDRTLECWGANGSGQASPPSGEYRDVSAGRGHSCAVTRDGTQARCWGSNGYGQAESFTDQDLTYPDAPSELFHEIAAGGYHTCALLQNRQVYCWGYDTYRAVDGGYGTVSPNNPDLFRRPGTAWEALDAGTWGSVAIDYAGDITGWGWPFLEPFTTSTSYRSGYRPPSGYLAEDVALGSSHACLLDSQGDVVCWGSNTHGRATPPMLAEQCPSGYYELEPLDLP